KGGAVGRRDFARRIRAACGCNQHRYEHSQRRHTERPGGVAIPADIRIGTADSALVWADGLDGIAVHHHADRDRFAGCDLPALTRWRWSIAVPAFGTGCNWLFGCPLRVTYVAIFFGVLWH